MTTTPPQTISLSASDIRPTEMYWLLRDTVMPRPIAWVSTVSAAGETNLAPFSFFNVCSPSPPVLGFSCGPRGDNHNEAGRIEKDTERNIREVGEFVVNIAPESLIEEMIRSADSLPPGQSEFAHTSLAESPSAIVRPPRVAAAPVAYECRLLDIVELGTNRWIMGTVLHVHVHQAAYAPRELTGRHRVDLLSQVGMRPVGRLGRAHYVRLRDVETHLHRDGQN